MTRLTHRPYGSEHPYATSPDQRVPVVPVVGEPILVGVAADGPVGAIVCEWQVAGPAGERSGMTPADVVEMTDADRAVLVGGEGHLAEAQAASLEQGGYAARLGALSAGERLRYRFVADGVHASTDWFEVEAAQWVPDPDFAAEGTGMQTSAPTLPQGPGLRVAGPASLAGRLVPGSVMWLMDGVGARRVRFALRLEAGEHVVGFGERFDAVDQRGRALDVQVFEQYKDQGVHGRTYLPMPFAHVVSASGSWGLHVRTSRRVWVDAGRETPDLLWVEVLTGAVRDLELALYDGTPTRVLDQFVDEVGRAEVLPDWVHRLWASGNEWNTQAIVMDRADHHRDLDIPIGALVIEAWSDELGIMVFRDARYPSHPDGAPYAAADFTYPPDGAWPDPAAMIDELHARGIKVILWQIPLLKTRFDLPADIADDAQVLVDGAAMVRDGVAVLEADGTPYHNRGWWFPRALVADLSTPRGREWWTERRRYLVDELDIDGFKTDGGEHAWGHDLVYGDGRRGDEGNNLYPVNYQRAFGDLLRSSGKAPVTFSRAGYTGSQAHGIFWAGDENSSWEAFASSVRAGVTASACGIVYWGWDIGGFSGPVPDGELYVRAAAASVFMPIMQYHSEYNHYREPKRDRTPWWVAEQHDDSRVIDEFRALVALRERLVPYLADSARGAVETGAPLMRALFFDYAADERIWQWPGEYLLGDDLLVHPVTRPFVESWSTYLPAGDWVDVWTGERLAGGEVVTRPVPRSVVPVYCRVAGWESLREVFA